MMDTVQPKPMNTTTCPMIDSLADNTGRLSWENACRVAAAHSLYEEFLADWGPKCCHDYDAGVSARKLAYWIGY